MSITIAQETCNMQGLVTDIGYANPHRLCGLLLIFNYTAVGGVRVAKGLLNESCSASV
jgi:hypothetical protein